jgi:hypothetical protein
METRRLRSVRGILTLGVLAALAAGLLLSPVAAKKGSKGLNKLRRNLNVIHGTEAGPGTVADTSTTIGQLTLPKGNYGIVAKVHLSTESTTGATIECVLANGTTVLDHGAVELPHPFQDVMALNTAAVLAGGGGTVELRCSDGSAAVATTWVHQSMTAFKMPKLTSIDLKP